MTDVSRCLTLTSRAGRVGVLRYDAADAHLVEGFPWHFSTKGYAVRTRSASEAAPNEPSGRLIMLHRQVVGLRGGDKRQVDHINRDKLDNRRENLRIVTAAQNAQNRGVARNNTSGFRGVTFHKASGCWCAQIRVAGQHMYSLHPTKADAVRAARQLRAQFMPFATDTATTEERI